MEQVRFKSGMEECTGSVDIETEVTLIYKVLIFETHIWHFVFQRFMVS